jgi:hypothetical protein
MSIDAKAILAKVQSNRQTLEACPLHKFSATEVRIGQKLTCDACGGELSLTDIGNYIRGYQAAGKAAADIWPAWAR